MQYGIEKDIFLVDNVGIVSIPSLNDHACVGVSIDSTKQPLLPQRLVLICYTVDIINANTTGTVKKTISFNRRNKKILLEIQPKYSH